MADLTVHTHNRVELVDITADVAQAVEQCGVTAGICNLFVAHTTAAVIVSENWDPDVTSDLLRRLEHLVPLKGDYRHSEGNSQAHILSVLLGTSTNVPVRDGRLRLGRWQGVMLAEFDGPRERRVAISVTPLAG
jgi:secondary thiamine-phosphate synthase enzyme